MGFPRRTCVGVRLLVFTEEQRYGPRWLGDNDDEKWYTAEIFHAHTRHKHRNLHINTKIRTPYVRTTCFLSSVKTPSVLHRVVCTFCDTGATYIVATNTQTNKQTCFNAFTLRPARIYFRSNTNKCKLILIIKPFFKEYLFNHQQKQSKCLYFHKLPTIRCTQYHMQ